jgi:hypothetical protein
MSSTWIDPSDGGRDDLVRLTLDAIRGGRATLAKCVGTARSKSALESAFVSIRPVGHDGFDCAASIRQAAAIGGAMTIRHQVRSTAPLVLLGHANGAGHPDARPASPAVSAAVIEAAIEAAIEVVIE